MAMAETQTVTEYDKGRSDTITTRAAFGSTPELTDYKNDQVRELMLELHNGVQTKNPMFGEVDLDYGVNTGALPAADPNMIGGDGGDAWTEFAPNIASPGAGNGLDPTKKPAPPPGTPVSSGNGLTTLASFSSQQIANQQPTDLAKLDKGKSGFHP